MKKYEIKQIYHKISKYIFCFFTTLIIKFFFDERKLTKDGLVFAIFLSLAFIISDIFKNLYRKRKYKRKHN